MLRLEKIFNYKSYKKISISIYSDLRKHKIKEIGTAGVAHTTCMLGYVCVCVYREPRACARHRDDDDDDDGSLFGMRASALDFVIKWAREQDTESGARKGCTSVLMTTGRALTGGGVVVCAWPMLPAWAVWSKLVETPTPNPVPISRATPPSSMLNSPELRVCIASIKAPKCTNKPHDARACASFCVRARVPNLWIVYLT